jgi:UDP-N-acetylglucosamine--N-acetylmuramyl-(pentapeptide) pyrophosphoryl-undecaprenol N-acetylglucosamine transferase
MVLHARAAPHITEHDHGNTDSFAMKHAVKRKETYPIITPQMKPRRVAVVGDGTAGHVYPALAIAEAYTQLNDAVDLLFIGTPHNFASQLVPPAGYRLVLVEGGPLFGVGLAGKTRTAWRLSRGVLQARRVLRASGTQLVIGVGGYASAAALLAAKSLRLCTAVYEANAVPGLTNRLLGRFVDRVYLGFAAAGWAFPAARQLATGNPIRPAITALTEEERRAPHAENRPLHLLVTGGSLGASFLNQRVPDLLRQVAERGVFLEVRHQVGGFAVEPVRAAYAQGKVAAVVLPYIEDMVEAYRWADLVIARAGAGTIAELAASGLPALLVPLPQAPGNHQVANAQAFTTTGGGWSVEEKDWKVEAVLDWLMHLLRDETAWTAASRYARQFATPHAARTIVADCETLLSPQFSGL